MDKRGFTLIEVITIIVIIGILMTGIVVGVSKYIDRAKRNTYLSYEKNIEVASSNNMIDCVTGKGECDIPESGYSKRLTVESLIDAGYSEKLKDPDKEGAFCSGYVLVTNEGASVPDLKYKGCIKCSKYSTPGCNFDEDNNDDNKILACDDIVGASTTWTRHPRTIKYGCNGQGKDCKYKKTFSGSATEPVIKQVELETINGEKCPPVDIYVDTTQPECELIIGDAEVGENGWYLEDVEVSLLPKNNITHREVKDYEIGISTSTKKEYNGNDKITATTGITTVFGYIKDDLGNEGYCNSEIKVDSTKPEQNLTLGYQIYPENKNESVVNTNVRSLKINDLEKYKSVKGVLLFLNESVTGNVEISYSTNAMVTGSISNVGSENMLVYANDQDVVEFILTKATTISSINISGIDPSKIEKVVMLVGNTSGLYTNKDMLVYNFASDTGTGVNQYRFKVGDNQWSDTWEDTKYVWISQNTKVNAQVLSSSGGVSEETEIIVDKIDKVRPNVTIKSYKYIAEEPYYTGDVLQVTKNENIVITGWSNHGYYFDISSRNDVLSGIDTIKWKWNRTGLSYLDKTIPNSNVDINSTRTYSTLTGEGYRYGEITIADNAGNERLITVLVQIDKTNPTAGDLAFRNNGSVINNGAKVNTNVSVIKNDGEDTLSGHLSTTYTVKRNGVVIDKDNLDNKTYREEGYYELVLTTKDKAGNISNRNYNFTIDKTAPVLTVEGYRCSNKNSSSSCNSSKIGSGTTVVASSTGKTPVINLDSWSIRGGVFSYSVNDENFKNVSWSWNASGCYSGECETINTSAPTTSTNSTGYHTLTSSGIRKATLTASDEAGNNASVDVVVYISNNFRITLNKQGGTGGAGEIVEQYGVGYYDSGFISNISSVSIPKKEGYTFGGYYTSTSGGTQIIDANGKIVSSSTKFTENTILYAHWTANTYIVTFDPNGGLLEPEQYTKIVIYDSTYKKLPIPERISAYTFEGWFTEKNGGNKIEAGSGVYITDNQTLYAHWKPKSYVLTFDANGGSVSPSTRNVTYGSAYGPLPKAVKFGYTFAGWYTVSTGGLLVTSDTKQGLGDGTIYAHWLKGACEPSGSWTNGTSEVKLERYANAEYIHYGHSGTMYRTADNPYDYEVDYYKVFYYVSDSDGHTTPSTSCFSKYDKLKPYTPHYVETVKVKNVDDVNDDDCVSKAKKSDALTNLSCTLKITRKNKDQDGEFTLYHQTFDQASTDSSGSSGKGKLKIIHYYKDNSTCTYEGINTQEDTCSIYYDKIVIMAYDNAGNKSNTLTINISWD